MRRRFIAGTIRNRTGEGQAPARPGRAASERSRRSAPPTAIPAAVRHAGRDPAAESRIVITCPPGLSDVLAEELAAFGRPAAIVDSTAAETRAPLAACAELNLWLRVAHRVLWLWGEFDAATGDDVYRGCLALAWEAVLSADRPISVRASVRGAGAGLPGAGMVALRCKDAIVDRLRHRLGRRPDSGPSPRGACVFVRIEGHRCGVHLDTSGRALSFRGYRRRSVAAPLRESLAAGVILASGWRGATALVNPMCGSGTLAIEGAWIAGGRAPGLLRETFSFLSLRGYDAEAWQALRSAAAASARPPAVPIVAADRDPAAVAAARDNAAAAGVGDAIAVALADLERTAVPGESPLIVLNPEYGMRTGDVGEDLAAAYAGIGRFLRANGRGGRGVVITGNLALSRRLGLRLDRKRTVFNGPVECRMLEFRLDGPPADGGAERRARRIVDRDAND